MPHTGHCLDDLADLFRLMPATCPLQRRPLRHRPVLALFCALPAAALAQPAPSPSFTPLGPNSTQTCGTVPDSLTSLKKIRPAWRRPGNIWTWSVMRPVAASCGLSGPQKSTDPWAPTRSSPGRTPIHSTPLAVSASAATLALRAWIQKDATCHQIKNALDTGSEQALIESSAKNQPARVKAVHPYLTSFALEKSG